MDLAYRKPASQSSFYSADTGAPKAVDGNRNPDWQADSCTQTSEAKGPVWWSVNLGELHAITNVTIVNRIHWGK